MLINFEGLTLSTNSYKIQGVECNSQKKGWKLESPGLSAGGADLSQLIPSISELGMFLHQLTPDNSCLLCNCSHLSIDQKQHR